MCFYPKDIFQPFELVSETRLIRSAVIYLEARQVVLKFCNDTISREEHKTIWTTPLNSRKIALRTD